MSQELTDEEIKEQSLFRFMDGVPEIDRWINVGVVGATGIVGITLLRILHQRKFPVGELHLYGTPKSEGRWINTPFGQRCVEVLNKRKPPYHDLVFMAAGTAVAREWGWRFAHRGAVVIDKSSYFRDKTYASLAIPEVNPETIESHRGIFANPNCTTIPLVVALKPLHDKFGLAGFTAVSFQSVSGSGRNGMLALERELEDSQAEATIYPHRIAHNVIPWIGSNQGGFSSEEIKMIAEPRKIMQLPRLPIRITAVRVPIMIGHSLAVHATFRRSISVERAREAFIKAPGITLEDDPSADRYPMPYKAVGRDDVLVGRIRRDRGHHGLAFWISTDNLRKGAATNAVQIAEILLSNKALGNSDDNTIS